MGDIGSEFSVIGAPNVSVRLRKEVKAACTLLWRVDKETFDKGFSFCI